VAPVAAAGAGGQPPIKPPATAVGTEEQLGDRFIGETLPAFAQWQDDIAKRIARAGNAEGASAALASWAQSAASDTVITDAIYRASMLAAMGGQLQVRLVEVPEVATARALSRFALAADGGDGGTSSGGNGGPALSFLALPFEEAIADFQARGIVTPEQFRAMDAAARQRAFTAAGFATDSLRQHAYDALLSALENGETLQQFAREIRSGEQSLGVSAADPAYVETVFRTNISSAYAAGRIQQMQNPDVLAARPYVQFRAIIDGRTTSQCRYCNNLTFNRQTDPGWVRFCPPLHFNCRSTTRLLPARSVSPSQVINSADVDPRGYPAPGFGGAPTLELAAE